MTDNTTARANIWTMSALVIAIMALVLIPFALFGDRIDAGVAALFETQLSPAFVIALIVVLLALDAPLPIPSSLVALASGALLGPVLGVAAVFVGLCLGSAVGYGLGRTLGHPALTRFGNGATAPALVDRMGPGLLIVTRAVPVLSETATIAAGALAMPLPRFIPPILFANAGLALLFGLAGAASLEQRSFLIAFGASIIVPLVGYLIWRRAHQA